MSSASLLRVRSSTSIVLGLITSLTAVACASSPGSGEEPTGAVEAAETTERLSFYHSDSCAGELLAFVGESTDCDELASHTSQAVWSIKVRGQCVDTADQPIRTACKAFKGALKSGSTVLYHSDSCGAGGALAYVNARTRCEDLGVSQAVWGISKNGQCSDISDMPFVSACNAFKGSGGGAEDVALFTSNRCGGSPVTTIGPNTDCRSLGALGSQRVSGVDSRGRCVDVLDMSAATACEAFRYAGDRDGIGLFTTNDCRPGSAAAYVGPQTQCRAAVGATIRAIEDDGRCIDVSDMSYSEACQVFQGGSGHGGSERSFYKSDSCSSQLVSIADDNTRCDDLGALGSQAVWGMKVEGRCYDLDDTTYENACHAFEAGNGPETVTFYKSDSCSGGLAAFVGPWTDCADLSRYVRSAVWAIQIDGQCQDISDSNFLSACERFKPSR